MNQCTNKYTSRTIIELLLENTLSARVLVMKKKRTYEKRMNCVSNERRKKKTKTLKHCVNIKSLNAEKISIK